MKIRSGFVSNSSSSSFIALSFSIKDVEEKYKKFLLAVEWMTEEELAEAIKKEQEKYSLDYENALREVFGEHGFDIGKKEFIRLLEGSEDGVGKDNEVVAMMLAETDSYDGGYFDEGEISLNESCEEFCRIKELRDKINPNADIKVIYGTRCC